MASANDSRRVLLIKGGRVYDHDGDLDHPPFADILIVDGKIAGVRSGLADTLDRGRAVAELAGRKVDETIDATEKLVMPGFVNAHYHSHDVLLKGCFDLLAVISLRRLVLVQKQHRYAH